MTTIRETVFRRGQRCEVVDSHRTSNPLPPTPWRWHVIRTAPRYELKVVAALTALALTAWCPIRDKTVTQGRKVVFKSERATLPGYAFVSIDPHLPRIAVTMVTGVVGFLLDPEARPLVVPQTVMVRLSEPVGPIPGVPGRATPPPAVPGFLERLEEASPDLAAVVSHLFPTGVAPVQLDVMAQV